MICCLWYSILCNNINIAVSLSLSLKQLESETNKQTAALQCNTTVLQVVNEVSSDQSPARNSEQTLFDIWPPPPLPGTPRHHQSPLQSFCRNYWSFVSCKDILLILFQISISFSHVRRKVVTELLDLRSNEETAETPSLVRLSPARAGSLSHSLIILRRS